MEKYLLKISYLWGDEEPDIECNSYDDTYCIYNIVKE